MAKNAHEPPRGLRRRIRDRLLQRARRRAALLKSSPDDLHWDIITGEFSARQRWTDLRGHKRVGISDWRDVFDFRDLRAHMTWQNPTVCSCWMCGNPRRHLNLATRQEILSDINAAEQFDDTGVKYRRRFRWE